jgi:hypothetical protein
MLLQTENLLSAQVGIPQTYVAVNLAAGGTALGVRNIAGFTNQYAVQLGKTGEELAEVLTISGAPSGTTINTAGTVKYPHPNDTPLYQIKYNQVIFKRSTVGTAGTAVALATVDIIPDSLYTQYDDTTGATTYAYKTQFYNSITTDVSAESAWFVPGGASFYSLQRLRSRAKRNLYNAGYIKEDITVDEWINEWQEQMTNKALKVDQAYSIGTAQYSFGTAGLGTISEPLFKYAKRIEVTTNGQTYVNSAEISINQVSSSDTYDPLSPRHYWQGDTIFGIVPSGTLGTARMVLGKLQSEMTDDDDTLPQYLRGYTTGCLEYCLYRAKSLDSKDEAAEKHYLKFIKNQGDFVQEITPRDQTGIKMIEMVESTGSEDDLFADYF